MQPEDTAKATHILEATLVERGRAVWRVGAAARATLRGQPLPAWVDLVCDASQAECDDLRANAPQIALESLAERELADVLKTRTVTIDAIAIAPDGTRTDPFDGLEHW